MPNEIMKRPVLKGGKIVSETDLSRIEKILLYMLLSSICVFSVLCIIIGFIYC
jgi:cell division protein FtsL